MKKLIGIIGVVALLALASISVDAQVVVMQKKFVATAGNVTVSLDTVTNTGTNYLTNIAPIAQTPGAQRTVLVVWTATKQSGTVAGTVTLQGSLDGTNFFTLTGGTAGVQTGAFTATNVASQTTAWTVNANYCKYYRVTWTGTGTMAATQAAKVLVQ